MKHQTREQAIVVAAFAAAKLWKRREWKPTTKGINNLIDALRVLFDRLSHVKQDQLLPPQPRKRGRKRVLAANEHLIASFLDEALTDGQNWATAIKTTQRRLLKWRIALPDADDNVLRRALKRYKRGELRARLPKPNF